LASRTGIKEGLLRRATHFTLFAVLGLLTGFGFGWYGIVAVIVWSIVDEVTKPLIPGRHCSAVDILLNLAGVVLGILVWLWVR
jgi:VanZ family protein